VLPSYFLVCRDVLETSNNLSSLMSGEKQSFKDVMKPILPYKAALYVTKPCSPAFKERWITAVTNRLLGVGLRSQAN
jgi:hypothetical protein